MFGKALHKLFLIIFLERKRGPIKLINFPEIYEDDLRPINLNIKKNIEIIKNSKKYLKIFILIN